MDPIWRRGIGVLLRYTYFLASWSPKLKGDSDSEQGVVLPECAQICWCQAGAVVDAERCEKRVPVAVEGDSKKKLHHLESILFSDFIFGGHPSNLCARLFGV